MKSFTQLIKLIHLAQAQSLWNLHVRLRTEIRSSQQLLVEVTNPL